MKKALLTSVLTACCIINAQASEADLTNGYPVTHIYRQQVYVPNKTAPTYAKSAYNSLSVSPKKSENDIRPYISGKIKFLSISSAASLESDEDDKIDIDDDIMGGSIAVGASFKLPDGHIRGEIELSQNSDVKDTFGSKNSPISLKIETQSVMANAYYDIDTGTNIIPYIGAGIGFVRIKGTESVHIGNTKYETSLKDTHFAWQLGGGTAVEMTRNILLDFGYRYIDYGHFKKYNMDYGEKVRLESSAHELYAGIRIMF